MKSTEFFVQGKRIMRFRADVFHPRSLCKFLCIAFFFFSLFLTKGPTTGNGEIDAVRCSMVRRIPEPKNRLERICMSVHANSGTSPALQLLWPDPETDKALDGRS